MICVTCASRLFTVSYWLLSTISHLNWLNTGDKNWLLILRDTELKGKGFTQGISEFIIIIIYLQKNPFLWVTIGEKTCVPVQSNPRRKCQTNDISIGLSVQKRMQVYTRHPENEIQVTHMSVTGRLSPLCLLPIRAPQSYKAIDTAFTSETATSQTTAHILQAPSRLKTGDTHNRRSVLYFRKKPWKMHTAWTKKTQKKTTGAACLQYLRGRWNRVMAACFSLWCQACSAHMQNKHSLARQACMLLQFDCSFASKCLYCTKMALQLNILWCIAS